MLTFVLPSITSVLRRLIQKNMEINKRACFAVIAATLVNKKAYDGVFDFSQSKHIAVSTSNAETGTPDIYDYNREGTVSGDYQSMYDYPSSSHVSIDIKGKDMECFDYESGKYISFNVNGSNVSAYDYETCSYYSYCVD